MKIKIKDITTKLCTQDIKLAKLVVDYINGNEVDYDANLDRQIREVGEIVDKTIGLFSEREKQEEMKKLEDVEEKAPNEALDYVLDETGVLHKKKKIKEVKTKVVSKKRRKRKSTKPSRWTRRENDYLFSNTKKSISELVASGVLDAHTKNGIASRKSSIVYGRLTREDARKKEI